MKTIIKALVWLSLSFFAALAHASLLEVSTYNKITYFADDQSTSLKRYSLVEEKFLTPITLAGVPKAVHADATGIYVSYGTSIVKLTLEGNSATQITVTSQDIYDIESTDTYLILAGYSYLKTLSKVTGVSAGVADLWYASPYISLSPDNNHIFTTSAGISPADIYKISLSSNGAIGSTAESPYHGDFAIGENPVAFPTQSRVVDTSGNVYNTMDLTFAGSLGGFYEDINFWQGLPIVLRTNKLYSYNQAMLETGTYSLSVPAQKIVVYLDNVFVFGLDTNGTIIANKYDVKLISPADPVAAIDPTNLAYTPDDKALDKDEDTLYLLSKSNLNIFRWSLSNTAYLPSIPLANAPLQFSYSSEQKRIYLGYSNGAVNYVDLKDNKEYPFANVGGTVSGLSAADGYVVVKGPTGAWGSLSVFNKDGVRTDYRDWVEPTSSVVWNSNYSRIYYISQYSPADLHWIELDKSTGKLGQSLDSPYHDSNGWSNPIRISETGRLIALGSGRVVDGKTMTQQALFYPYTFFKDVTWLNGNVFTIKSVDSDTYTQLERWQANYARDDSATYEVQGSPIGLAAIPNAGKLIFIYSRDGIPRFEIRTYSTIDSDKDGYLDGVDAFPDNASEWLDFDDDGIGNNADTDDDGDGVSDTQDAFPLNANETLDSDKDGIGNNADTDDDNDGILDVNDVFPLNPLESKDMDNDGIGDNSDNDIDGDGVLNSGDPFPMDALESLDTDKDGIGNNTDTDDDNDGVPDYEDRFPSNPQETKDLDYDGIGDNTDTDIDGDGVLNAADPFPLNQLESLDTDKDGKGNNADIDDDNDGILDIEDAFPLNPLESKDMDHDGVGDNSDIDIDGDGVFNAGDPFPMDSLESLDSDKDGVGNSTDNDDDNDGVADNSDFYPTNAAKSAMQAADFFPTRKGSSWKYDFGSQPVILGSEMKIAGKSLSPLIFPTGYKLYLNVVDNQIQFFGMYLPGTTTSDGSFSLDITLDRGVSLTNNIVSGTGNVNIVPKYGDKNIKWTATASDLGLEKVLVPAGQYLATHTRLVFSGTTVIDGRNASISYSAEIWFAENVGIVKMIDNGYPFNLVSATIPEPQPASNGGGNSGGSTGGGKGGGGGGSIDWLTLLPLLLLFHTPNLRSRTLRTRKSN